MGSSLPLSLLHKPVPHQLLVSVTPLSQPPERTTTTLRNSGRVTGPNTELPTQPTKTAPSPSPTTGRVPNNAPNPGSAEVPDSAREADGAPVMTGVREPHSQTKLQVSSQITDQFVVSYHCEAHHFGRALLPDSVNCFSLIKKL